MSSEDNENFAQAVAIKLGYERVDGGWCHPNDATQSVFPKALSIPEIEKGMRTPKHWNNKV